MKLDRMECPTCHRQVAFRLIRGPRVNRGKPIPGIRVPVPHNRLDPKIGYGEPCTAGKRRKP